MLTLLRPSQDYGKKLAKMRREAHTNKIHKMKQDRKASSLTPVAGAVLLDQQGSTEELSCRASSFPIKRIT